MIIGGASHATHAQMHAMLGADGIQWGTST